MKRCYKCGETKPFEDFNKDRSKSDGYSSRCRKCQKVYKAERLSIPEVKQQYEEKTREARKRWGKNNKDRVAEYHKRSKWKRRARELGLTDDEYHKFRMRHIGRVKAGRRKNLRAKRQRKEKQKRVKWLTSLGYRRCWACIGPNGKKGVWKRVSQFSPSSSRCKKCTNQYYRQYRRTPQGRKKEQEKQLRQYRKNGRINVTKRVRNRITKSLKNRQEWVSGIFEHLGYTATELIEHLITTLPDGYTWDDYLDGVLHIDHIKPISRFNYKSIHDKEFGECWALSNLQLLTDEENLKKNNRYEGE